MRTPRQRHPRPGLRTYEAVVDVSHPNGPPGTYVHTTFIAVKARSPEQARRLVGKEFVRRRLRIGTPRDVTEVGGPLSMSSER